MEQALILAKSRAGGPGRLGRALGISQSAVSQWRICPARRVLDVERLSCVPRYELRPDLYPAPKRAKRSCLKLEART